MSPLRPHPLAIRSQLKVNMICNNESPVPSNRLYKVYFHLSGQGFFRLKCEKVNNCYIRRTATDTKGSPRPSADQLLSGYDG